jgi:hypothetical protein
MTSRAIDFRLNWMKNNYSLRARSAKNPELGLDHGIFKILQYITEFPM